MKFKFNLFRGGRRNSVQSKKRNGVRSGGMAASTVEQLEGRQLCAAGTTKLWVEAGSTSSFTDSGGKVWSADRNFVGGYVSTGAYAVANTTDDKLYYTRRVGSFSYSLPATNGDYNLRLYFADPLYTTAGKRKFNVSAERKLILSNFDVAANGGGKAAIVRSFPVTVADGRLNLSFSKGTIENPIVSAIELLPAGYPTARPAAPTGLSAAVLSSPTRVNLSWKDASLNETHFRVERSVNGGAFGFLANVGRNALGYTDASVSAGVNYGYRVRAVNQLGASAPSNTAFATVQSSPPPPTPTPTTGWVTTTSAPVARVEPGGIQVGGKLYIWGGFTGGPGYPVHNRFDVFDMASQTWSTRRPAPAPQTHAALATNGRYIFAAGGQYGGGLPGTPSADVWRYDTTTDSWSSALPDLPEARYGGGLGHLNNKLYFFAGNRPDRTTVARDLWVLDLANPAAGWVTRASLPIGLSGDHMSAAVLNGRIYAIGGEHGHAADEEDTDAPYIQHNYLMEYNPATNVWTRKANMPQASSHFESATLVVNGKIIALGGQIDDIKTTAAVRAYDPVKNAWSVLTPLPDRRKGGVAGYWNGKFYYTGGQRDGDWLVSVKTWSGTLSGV